MNLRNLLPCFAAIAVALCGVGVVQADAIVNGDFGTGDLTGWTTGGAVSIVTSPAPPEGTYCASLWAGPSGLSELNNNFYASAGDVVSFEYQGTGAPGESYVWALLVGNGGAPMTYMFAGYSSTVLSAQWQIASCEIWSSGYYNFQFAADEGLSGQVDMYIADVWLTPEPATTGLLAAGLGTLLLRRRIGRRKK